MSLYYSPVFYGINDVTIPEAGGSFGARIYYPSEEDGVFDVSVRTGEYPLVAFAHGDRSSEPSLCPADRTEDYKRWGAVLHLLARCGFVVISPAVHDVIFDPIQSAIRMETAIGWARSSWAHREVLHRPGLMYLDPDVLATRDPEGKVAKPDLRKYGPFRLGHGFGWDPRVVLGPPTELGVVGHSWGARAAAHVAARGNVTVRAIASIAGSWDDSSSIQAFKDAKDPSLMIAGTEDFLNASYLQGLWNGLVIPKHQALIQDIGHWDWFGPAGSISQCSPSAPEPNCGAGGQTASELVLAFMTKYLLNNWWRPPYLLGSPGGRPPLIGNYLSGGDCAMKIRWVDPMASSSQGTTGDVTLGTWTGSDPW
jgi:hypothetical protein